jgi:putative transposase
LLYVAAVVDLSRRVVDWSMSATMTAQLVTDALVMMIWRRGKPRALLHYSDPDSQYTSEQFQRLMTERIARKTYRTRNNARAGVID